MSLLLALASGYTPINYTLACNAGSYVFTGSSATFTRTGGETESGGGGGFRVIGKRQKEIYAEEERIRLQALPKRIRKIAKKTLENVEALTDYQQQEVIEKFTESIYRSEAKNRLPEITLSKIDLPKYDNYTNIFQSILIARKARNKALIQQQIAAEIEIQLRLELEQELDDESCILLLM